MRIIELTAGPVTLRSLLVVLLLVGVATAVNVHLNPPPPRVEEEDSGLEFYEIIESVTWLNYTRFDIKCWYPEGMRLEEFRLEGRAFSYHEGGLRGYGDPTETNRAFIHAGEFFLVWKPSGSFDSLAEALDYALQATGYGERISYDESQLQVLSPMLTWQGHHVAGGMLNGTGWYNDRWVGMFDTHECAETGRVLVWFYIDFEKYVPYSYKYNGVIFFATYRCHLIEEDWIEDLIG